MNDEKREVILISASPKVTDQSVSEWLASVGETRMKAEGLHISRINVRKSLTKGGTESDFAAMLHADALVIIFPLYIFCLPGILMRFLQDYFRYYEERKGEARRAKVYAIVNCGFPEPGINFEAVRVIQRFAEKTGAAFRFGVLIGGGPMIQEAKDAPFMKRIWAQLDEAFTRMKEDVLTGALESPENVQISVHFPRKLYFFMGGSGWVLSARKNGLKKKDLYRRPYRE